MAQVTRGTRIAEPRLPASIGRYKVVSRIGKGAMGVVYHAHDELMDRAVAIKVLTADLAGDPSIRTRFFREAKVAGQIVHPNVITVFDMGEENGRLFIVMELLHGQTLGDYLRANPSLPVAEKLDIMTQVCGGMAAAHARGVVHRDLKPSNLFVQNDGVVKLLDFGVARLADSNVTAAGLIIGTPDYMSPEQARGGEIDARADIFSGGAVFYFLLTGRRPFAAKDLPTLLQKVEMADPPPIPDTEAPPAVAAIVMKALQKQPADRYQSFQELLTDLLRVHKSHEAETRRAVEAVRAAYAQLTEHAQASAAAAAALGYESRGPQEAASLLARFPALGAAPVADAERLALQRALPALAAEVEQVRGACAEDARRASEWLARHRVAEDAWQRGDLEAAERDLALVAAQQPAATRTAMQLARVRAAIHAAAQRAARERDLLAAGEAAAQAGTWAEAQRLAEEALAANPESAAARSLRDRAVAEVDRAREAAVRRERAARLALDAQQALSAGDADGALRLAREARQLDPSQPLASELEARADAWIKQAAAETARRAAAHAHAEKVRHLLGHGKTRRAVAEAERAAALAPDDATLSALLEEARRQHELRAAQPIRPAWLTPRVLAATGAVLGALVLAGVVLSTTWGDTDAPRSTPPATSGPSASPATGTTTAAVSTPANVASTAPPAAAQTADVSTPEAAANLPALPRVAGEDDVSWILRREQALARFEEGNTLLRRGRFPQALAVFEALARAEPEYPGIGERLAATRRQIESAPPPARRVFEEGTRLEGDGDMLGAMAKYRAARAADASLPGVEERIATLGALMVARAERLISEAEAAAARDDRALAVRRYEEALRYLPAAHAKVASVREQLERLRGAQ